MLSHGHAFSGHGLSDIVTKRTKAVSAGEMNNESAYMAPWCLYC